MKTVVYGQTLVNPIQGIVAELGSESYLEKGKFGSGFCCIVPVLANLLLLNY